MTTFRQHAPLTVTRCIMTIIATSASLLLPLAAQSAPLLQAGPLSIGSADEILHPPTPKLKPRREATADERDRATAVRLFAEARFLFHRNRYDAALKKYQRASRIHPNSLAIAREVVPLAADMGRLDMSARYALLAADQPPADPPLIYRLALAKAINDQQEEARRLYEIAVEYDQSEIPSPIALFASLELGRIYYLQGQYDLAAQALQSVDQALQAPADYGLETRLQQMLLADLESTYAMLFESYLKTGQLDDAAAALQKANDVSQRPMQLFRTAQLLAAKKDQVAATAKINEYLETKSTEAGTEPYALLVLLLSDQDRTTAQDTSEDFATPGSSKQTTPRETDNSPNVSATVMAHLEELRRKDLHNVALAVFVAQQYLNHDPPDAEQLARAEKILSPFVSEIAPVEIYQELLRISVARSDWKKTLALAEQWIDTVGTLAALDDQLLEQLDLQESRSALLAIVDDPKQKTTAQARVAVAQLALRAKEYSTAARLFQSASAPSRKSIAVLLLDGGIEFLSAEQFELASQLLQKVVASQLPQGQAWVARYYLAGALEMQHRTQRALAVIDTAVASNPKNAILLGRKAWILEHAGKSTEAGELYEQILNRFADNYASPETRETIKDARSSLSNLRVKERRLAEAEELLQQILDEFPEDSGAMNDLGYLWADQGKLLRRARRLVEKALRADPDNAAYHDSLGWVQYRLGDPASAVEQLEKAVSLSPSDPVVLQHLGDALQSLGRKTDAIEVWQRARTLYIQEKDEDGRTSIEKRITKSTAE